MCKKRLGCFIPRSLPDSPRVHTSTGGRGPGTMGVEGLQWNKGARSSPTGPSWETVCMLKESSWPGFWSSSRRLEKALAIILLFLMRLGSSSLCPVNLRAEGVGEGKGRSSHFPPNLVKDQ